MAQTETLPGSMATAAGEPTPELSVVVTLYNEVGSLDELHRRAIEALEGLGRPFEIVYVDDGSTDGTFAVLERLHAADARVHALRFKRNFGQHPAMHAGLSRARGDIVVTMDGDLQNLPEDIRSSLPRSTAATTSRAGGRAARNDSWGRTSLTA
jgi:glycosyltransferase involved in cell wall biosynthesis